MKLSDFVIFSENLPEKLPQANEIIKKTEKMAKDLSDVADAPTLDNYIGPVIFEGQASAEFFRQLLGKNLCGLASLTVDDKRLADYYATKESEFKGRLNLRILPDFFDVWVDPEQKEFQGKSLIGSYNIDDEGISSAKVKLIEKGILKNFLMSRTPIKGINGSNGHGRAPVYGKPEAKLSNLLINVSKGKTMEELKKQLLDLCREQNREYGLIIRSMSTGDPDPTQISTPYYGSQDSKKSLLTPPIAVYQIFRDGKEKIIRGIEFSNIIVRVLKDIISASKEYVVYNYPLEEGSFGSRSDEAPPIGCSIVAPSVLVEEIEAKKISEEQKKPPYLKHPYFK
jgi:hypothetical protein